MAANNENERTTRKPLDAAGPLPSHAVAVLLVGSGIMLVGNGLFSTLLGVRANIADFSPAVTGTVMSGYFIGFVVGAFLCTRFVEQVGHIRTFSALAAIIAAIAITHAMVVHPLAWLVLRLLTGLSMVGLFLVIESWLNAEAQSGMRGRVFATYMVVNLAAMALGQLVLAVGDPKSFVPFGLVTILFAVGLVPVALARIQAPVPQEAVGLRLRRLYVVSPVGILGCFTAGIVTGGFWGMGSVFAKQIGLSDASVGVLMFATVVGGILSQWPIGRLSDFFDRRKMIGVVAFLAAGFALSVCLLANNSLHTLIGASAFFGAFMFPLYSLCVASAHDTLPPGHALAATRGLMLVYGVGAIIGPLSAGVVMNLFSARSMFAYFAIVYVLTGLFVAYRLTRRNPVPSDQRSAFVPMVRTSQEGIEMAVEAAHPQNYDPTA